MSVANLRICCKEARNITYTCFIPLSTTHALAEFRVRDIQRMLTEQTPPKPTKQDGEVAVGFRLSISEWQ